MVATPHTYPKSPPRVRVEWLLAGTRVAVAASALVAVTLDTPEYIPPRLVAAVLGGYLLYGCAVLALVWSPVRFGRGWALAVHAFDLIVFALLASMTEVAASPFFASFTFLVISASLRWRTLGTVITVIIALGAYTEINAFGEPLLGLAAFHLNTFAARALYLVGIATVLGYFGAIQQRSYLELVRLASWPRQISRDPRDAVSEVIFESTDLVEAPRVLLVWEEPSEGRMNLAWQGDSAVVWTREAEGTYGSLVLPGLERWSFQASDASLDHGDVATLTETGFRYRKCRPLNEALRERFNIKAVQSWPLAGELVQGRLFALDKTRMRIDDLLLGELVARLAVARLDSLYVLERLRDAAALEARVRVARDLHDSLLQDQTGAALQLLVARRQLDTNPIVGRARLEEVQRSLERGELEMRSFIRRLRPEKGSNGHAKFSRLTERLETLRRRLSQQWDVKVTLNLDGADNLSSVMAENVYRLAQEGSLNAARHADASLIRIELAVEDASLRLAIDDDGHGFPFQGTYNLGALSKLGQGPLTLRERVESLRGDLTLQSNENGTQILITLPLVPTALNHGN
jgi:signal transduction histidine kinase